MDGQPPSVIDPACNFKDLHGMFNKFYYKWSRSEPIDKKDTGTHINKKDFLKSSNKSELVTYIELIEHHIQFNEPPLYKYFTCSLHTILVI